MDEIYDLVVIGAGPAGEVAAGLAASLGRRALIVERNKPGGVVTTTGGAPTKALREAALYLTGYRQEEVYGVRAAAPLIAAQLAAGLLAVVWLIGIYAIIVGIMHIVVYFESRSLASSLA